MTSRPLVMKLGVLLLPAMLMLGGLKLFGSDLGRFGTKLTSTPSLEVKHGANFYVLPPTYRYEKHVKDWTTNFLTWMGTDQVDVFGFCQPPSLTVAVYVDRARFDQEGRPHSASEVAIYRSWLRHDGRIIIDASQGMEEAGLQRALSHQLTHALMRFQGKHVRWPAWLSEGLAIYFESTTLGVVNANARAVRSAAPQFKPGLLDQLLSLEAFPEREALLHHEASYALVLYLLHGPGGFRQRFLDWYRGEAKADRPAQGIEKVLGPLSDFEAAWIEWARSPKLDR